MKVCRKLTNAEIEAVKTALEAGRRGSATLMQLSHAHGLAEDACLNGTLGELREHIRKLVPGPPGRTELKAVGLGVVSGFVVNFLLKLRRQ